VYIIQKAAEIIGVPLAELTSILRVNAKTFYNLRDKGEELQQPQPTLNDLPDEENEGSGTDEPRDNLSEVAIPVVTTTSTSNTTLVTTSVTEASTPSTSQPDQEQKSPPQIVNNNARYACTMCRSVLFASKHMIPHEQGLDSIKFLKRARNDVEFDNGNVIFVRELEWLREASVNDRMEAGEFVVSGNISCPECSAKVGKWHISPEWENNDTDDNVQSDDTIYVIVRKRIDMVLPGMDAQTLADYAQEYETGGKNSTTQQSQKKKKQQKKNTKQNNRSNMGNFRNKSFLPNASKTKSDD